MDRKIIINADDFGLCSAVNEAVKKAHQQGVLTSATLMANMEAAEDAVAIAAEMPALGVGVHLNLNEGRPMNQGPAVEPLRNSQGLFAFSPARAAFTSLISPRYRRAIEAELTSQIQWCLDKGVKPTHLDSHKHIHSFVSIYPIVVKLARKFKVKAVRWPYEPGWMTRKPMPKVGFDDKKRAIKVRSMARMDKFLNSGLTVNKRLLGVAHTGKIDENFWLALCSCDKLNGVSEVMTHPGFSKGLDREQTRLVEQRQTELDALCSQKVRDAINNAGLELINYANV
jgi:hopanoid biosynthesis associated protein HpnK